jgi:hypothetical protein
MKQKSLDMDGCHVASLETFVRLRGGAPKKDKGKKGKDKKGKDKGDKGSKVPLNEVLHRTLHAIWCSSRTCRIQQSPQTSTRRNRCAVAEWRG